MDAFICEQDFFCCQKGSKWIFRLYKNWCSPGRVCFLTLPLSWSRNALCEHCHWQINHSLVCRNLYAIHLYCKHRNMNAPLAYYDKSHIGSSESSQKIMKGYRESGFCLIFLVFRANWNQNIKQTKTENVFAQQFLFLSSPPRGSWLEK